MFHGITHLTRHLCMLRARKVH